MYKNLADKKLFLPITLMIILIFFSQMGHYGSEWLSYDRISISNGQLWRLFTSHLIHTGLNHLTLNMLGLIMIFLFFGHLFSRQFWLTNLTVCMLGISLCLYLFHPELKWYVGLSGVLHGLMVIGTIGAIKNKWNFGYLILIAVATKLIIEQLKGPSLDTMNFIGIPIIIESHLYGAITGLLLSIMYLLNGYLEQSKGWSCDIITKVDKRKP